MRRLRIIGIGAGDPMLLTLQAIEALDEVDVFVVVDKGEAKDDLAAMRRQTVRQHASRRQPRVVEIDDPARDATLPYHEAVDRWHEQRVLAFERVLAESVADHECAGILVWGDPSLYDSTLRIVDRVLARGIVTFEHTVVPGISSIQLLAARHRIALNQIGRAIHITTGRLLRQGVPPDVDDVVVMLDGSTAFTELIGQSWTIYWGAYLGGQNEILVAGLLDEVADQIVSVRAEARERTGWMFDTYLLRRNQPRGDDN